jgi:hypothetical protein
MKKEKRKGSILPGPVMENVADSANVMKKQGRGRIVSDVLGSYTGTPSDGDVPEQDGDDI